MASAVENTPMQNFMLSIDLSDKRAIKLLELLKVLEFVRIEKVQDNK